MDVLIALFSYLKIGLPLALKILQVLRQFRRLTSLRLTFLLSDANHVFYYTFHLRHWISGIIFFSFSDSLQRLHNNT